MVDQTLKSELQPKPQISLKSVALPPEHGGWGFLLEPILLGLLVAPSIAGFWLCLSAFGVFLIHQPLKITLKDHLKGKRYARTIFAERFTFGYGILAGVGLLLALLNTLHAFWLPLLLAVPFALVQTAYEIRNEGRELLPEIAGAVSLGAVAPAVALAAGHSLSAALLLWVLLAMRAVTSILYIRSRIRLEKGKSVQITPTLVAHLTALVLTTVLVIMFGISGWSLVAVTILTVRAVMGLSSFRKPRKVKTIGFMEMGYGLLSVIMFSL